MHDSPPPPIFVDQEKTVWVRPLAAIFVSLVLLVLCIFFFDAIKTVLLGLLAATIVACTLSPMLRYVPGRRGLSAAILGLGLIAIVAGLIFALSYPLAGPIAKQWNELPKMLGTADKFLKHSSDRFGLSEPLTTEKLMENIGYVIAGGGGQKIFSGGADFALGIVIWLAFIFIGSIFLMAESNERLLRPALSLWPPKHRAVLRAALIELAPKLRWWVLGTLTSMCIVFTASLLGYLTIGLEFAVPLAMLAAVCEIVPTVGPAVACVIASIFAASTQGASTVVGVLMVYVVIQSIEAYVILPMIMRGAVKIHPAVTLFTVVLWGKIFGVPGLCLAIPINLTLWTLADHFIIRQYKSAE